MSASSSLDHSTLLGEGRVLNHFLFGIPLNSQHSNTELLPCLNAKDISSSETEGIHLWKQTKKDFHLNNLSFQKTSLKIKKVVKKNNNKHFKFNLTLGQVYKHYHSSESKQSVTELPWLTVVLRS